jgi:hypothetical protein
MTLEFGDHIWYWSGKTSLSQNIPRHEWFPDSNAADPNDYSGHGSEIFYFVVYPDQIARGQPHMRNRPGSFSWMNNNPGNITGVRGGPDFGQYAGKFSWHNFLIFPDWSTGFDAIAKLLRGPGYASLSILDAFKKYAPASDGGNNPVQYANDVATALNIDVNTLVGDLNDDQMVVLQNKVQDIEGAIAGDSLAWNSDEIPSEIANQLPAAS